MLVIPKNHPTSEIAIDRAGADGDLPRRDIGNGGVGGAGVPGRANHSDPLHGGMEGSDGEAVVEEGRGASAEGGGDDVDAVGDSGVEGGEDVGVEALVALDGSPADLVGGDAGARGATLGGAVAEVEDADIVDEVAAGGGEGVGTVAFDVARGIYGGGR